jgi:membrane-associated progesterone receptor component
MAEKNSDETFVESTSFLTQIVNEIIKSPLNLALIGVITLLIYKIFKSRTETKPVAQREPELPKLRRDFTVEELRPYDGTGADGRVLVAVNGNVYDVTKGKRFYGPGGPYAAFGGRDASRGLATFSVTATDEIKYDDLSDLNSMEMESVREWEMQFKEKYDLVGKLLKPGEPHNNYSDEDEDPNTSGSTPSDQKTETEEQDTKSKVDKVEQKTVVTDENKEKDAEKDENPTNETPPKTDEKQSKEE